MIYMLTCLPFILDAGISLYNVEQQINRESTCTIEEETAEDFVSQYNESTRPPSEVILPPAVAENEPISNLLTRNWKDGGYLSTSTIEKQLISFVMIMAYLGLGTQMVVSEENVPLGAVTVAYGASSLLGYFNIG